MDALALLCTLHADGPSSLKRLRSRGCGDLSTLLSRTPDAVADDLKIERPAARRLIREARLLADRVGISALEVEEAPPTADTPAPTRALIQAAAEQPGTVAGLDSVDRALVERITRPAPTRPGDPSDEPEAPGELQEPAGSEPAATAPGLDRSLPEWLEGPAVPTADDPFSVPGADFGPAEVLGQVPAQHASAGALDPAAETAAAETAAAETAAAAAKDPISAIAPLVTAPDSPGGARADGGEIPSEQPAMELTFSEALTVAEAQDLALRSGEGPAENTAAENTGLQSTAFESTAFKSTAADLAGASTQEPAPRGPLAGGRAPSFAEISEALDRALPDMDPDPVPAVTPPAPRDPATPRAFGAAVFGEAVFEEAPAGGGVQEEPVREEPAHAEPLLAAPVSGARPFGEAVLEDVVREEEAVAPQPVEAASEDPADLGSDEAAELAHVDLGSASSSDSEVEDESMVEVSFGAELSAPAGLADVSSPDFTDVGADVPVPIPAIAEEVSAASQAALPGMDEALVEDLERLGIESFGALSIAESLALTRGLGVTFAQARRLRFLARRAEAEGRAWPASTARTGASTAAIVDQLEDRVDQPEDLLEEPEDLVAQPEAQGEASPEERVAAVLTSAPFAAEVFRAERSVDAPAEDEARAEPDSASVADEDPSAAEELLPVAPDAPLIRPFAAEINEAAEIGGVSHSGLEPEPDAEVAADQVVDSLEASASVAPASVASAPEALSPASTEPASDVTASSIEPVTETEPPSGPRPVPAAAPEQQGVRVDPSEVQARPRFGDQFARAAEARRASSEPGRTVLGWNFEIPRPEPETLPLASITASSPASAPATPGGADGVDGGAAPADGDAGGPFVDA